MQTHPEMPPLSGWATIAEVSDALTVKYDTIKHAVEKARALQQDWVKQEPYPVPGCPLRWLIDTSHPIYRYHEQRWRKLAEKTRPEQTAGFLDDMFGEEDEERDEMVFDEEDEEMEEMEAMPCYSPSATQQQAIDGTATWSAFCHWLAQLGLVVFVNAIDADQGWQWSWRNHSGAGYADATAAIIAALRYQLVLGAPFLPLVSTSLDRATESGPFVWKKLLRWQWSWKKLLRWNVKEGSHERS